MDSQNNTEVKDFSSLSSTEEKIEFLLNFAVLAPSTHNTQPWKFKIKSSSCEIYIDTKKVLTASDKSGRNLYISLGACIENLLIASKYLGVYSDIAYFTNRPADEKVCEVFFKQLSSNKSQIDESYADMFRAISKRVTYRGFYLPKKIPKHIISSVEGMNNSKGIKIRVLTSKKDILSFSKLAEEGIKTIYGEKEFREEMSSWINPNNSARKEGIPGYALNLPLFVSLLFPTVMKYFNLSKIIAKINAKSVNSMAGVCIVSSEKNDCSSWLQVGMVSQRIFLYLVTKDIFSYITVAAVDVGNVYLKVADLVNCKHRPQFSFGIGYANGLKRNTPRLNLHSKLI